MRNQHRNIHNRFFGPWHDRRDHAGFAAIAFFSALAFDALSGRSTLASVTLNTGSIFAVAARWPDLSAQSSATGFAAFTSEADPVFSIAPWRPRLAPEPDSILPRRPSLTAQSNTVLAPLTGQSRRTIPTGFPPQPTKSDSVFARRPGLALDALSRPSRRTPNISYLQPRHLTALTNFAILTACQHRQKQKSTASIRNGLSKAIATPGSATKTKTGTANLHFDVRHAWRIALLCFSLAEKFLMDLLSIIFVAIARA
jgi:hypothetical protein